MRDTIRNYLPIVQFLGSVLGSYYEIILIELKDEGSGIVAIENSHISGRKIGDGLTDLCLRFIKEETYKDTSFKSNYTCISNGRKLRGSTYFIKEGDMLVGMLCINFDTETFIELDTRLLQFANIQAQGIIDTLFPPQGVPDNNTETVLSSVTELCEQEVRKYAEKNKLDAKKFTQENRIEIIEHLNNLGIFLIKGIVPDVANLIGTSEASVYRYLSIVNRKKK
ncbi:helix-turn-helix transcriptional regulator [Sediminispirochaeta smaragdinae]|jgi:predicted transcriptional regulator YheO|uniref:YheO domain protein n=1 Tax=Sediminispirochaeta smaragdinae (strain DSM 11293 / JCM 15392 / SEBR 4228) TaxID=573413 RepID=E1RAA1_SEDSS|nr:PAS domain-containing protein [Sediminispirochaeta smaragdinae]ADK79392.1 YheO domain protein [Sediminispirochaeta smaragdinae DSM 11293]